MPSLMAMLGLDATAFQTNLTKSQKFAQQAGNNIASSLTAPIKGALGAFAASALISGAFAAGERIRALSREYQVSAETIQRWEKAAEDSGLTAEDVGNAFIKLKKARDEAVSSGNLGGFREFGISMEALKDASISTEQVLQRMIQVVGSNPLTDAQDVAGMELMGRSGSKLLSVFQELDQLGPLTLLTDEQIEKMHQAVESFEDLKRFGTSLVGKAWLGATEGSKSLVQMGRDLWRLAFGGGAGGEVFRFDIGDAYGGPKGNVPSKLTGPVTEGMTTAQVTAMKRTQLEIAEKIFQNSLKTMNAEEKRAALNQEIKKHMEASEKAFEEGEWAKGYEEKLRAEQIRGELLSIKNEKAGKADVNALQRIGAFSSIDTSLLSTAQKSEQHLARLVALGEDAKNKGGGVGGFD